MGQVNSPGAGKITDEALLSHTNPLIGISFFLSDWEGGRLGML
jgi:hypothetical protein